MNEDKGKDQIIEGHEYDGIRELDNPLPKWWLYLFYATIVFAAGYYGYYELFGGPSHEEQYEAAMERLESERKDLPDAKEMLAKVSVEDLLNDPEALEVGKKTFKQYCAACHKEDGGGMIGPNLTDDYWIHSQGDYEGISQAILEGFPEKGMPPWKDVIPVEEQPKLAAFVITLQGTDPQDAKAPQGEKIN